VPVFNHAIGDPCTCANGKPGRLEPHPTIASSLYCRETTADTADQAYRRMVDEAPTEYLRYGPRRDACCGNCAGDQNIADPSPPKQRKWPRGGYGVDPNAAGGSNWPDPRTLSSVREGDQCMTDDKRPGTIREGRCVASGRDQAASNIGPPSAPAGFEWAEGGECRLGSGETGLYVKEGDRLVCKPRDFDADAQSIRDRAYYQSVADAQTDYLRWK
jgi:hypothetical protein